MRRPGWSASSEAHCHGQRGIMAALEAGVKTIEHGTYLDEEAADAMVESGAILVPTRFILKYLLAEGSEDPAGLRAGQGRAGGRGPRPESGDRG